VVSASGRRANNFKGVEDFYRSTHLDLALLHEAGAPLPAPLDPRPGCAPLVPRCGRVNTAPLPPAGGGRRTRVAARKRAWPASQGEGAPSPFLPSEPPNLPFDVLDIV